MKRLAGLMALAVLLSFGTVTTLTYAGDPPAPTDEKDKDKQTGGPKLFADEKKDEKKDEKGGK
jgi:hypothetical protein